MFVKLVQIPSCSNNLEVACKMVHELPYSGLLLQGPSICEICKHH